MTISREEKSKRMYALVLEYENGSKGLKAFCEEHGVSKDSFKYWRKKMNREATISSGGFMEVKLSGSKPVVKGVLRIRYKTGTELELPSNYGFVELCKLLKLELC